MPPDPRRDQIESLFRRYAPGVGSYVLARVGNRDIAEQITSSVFLIVVRRIEQCRGPSAAAWLWSIVRSEIARHYRQRRATEPLEEHIPDPDRPAPPEAAERQEMQGRMHAALAQLTDEQQRLVYLKFFQDMPNTEIAESLGLSVSNVGVIVHRAVKRMRELMGEGPAAETQLRSIKGGTHP